MAYINSYEQATSLAESDVFLVDKSTGTKNITAKKLADILVNMKASSGYIPIKRMLFRYTNLGSTLTTYQLDAIDDGSFHHMCIGDYWESGSVTISGTTYPIRWQIVDFDYWWNTGNVACKKHHVVIMPNVPLYTGKMNDTDTTEGGYVGSKMYKEGLNQAKELINSIFGEGHVLKHKEFLCNSVGGNVPNGGAWYDSTVELPNEIELIGHNVYLPASTGVTRPYRITNDRGRLALFTMNPIYIGALNLWLRDPASQTNFCYYGSNGCFQHAKATNTCYVRPVFGLCKANA